ncbi:porphobilinogen deaminase, dipyromethane cofactor binding domain protein [Chlamydia ibidis]|uniref:hydroxymethylbilane synthase n=2 Tax=Chlamydia ibidis TaxID=1405396 RepID=S7J2C7_9CHLA|nr:hydroxymethylbilane synthase [Chlamydia ibidis]EPP34383.1 porphobilinogen deaminase, dipyromethane cofactor binding domain protein [Chlamydia ibidis]EQM62890.1 porphobilinogen deaminase, dipyromethane cofactor binding domain protein [Chlamydia ibidis 10-1398/6]
MLSACYTDPFLSQFCQGKRPIRIATRNSPLAKAQVYEVATLLRAWYPKLRIELSMIDTRGDKDKTTPIRLVENTNFFTEEVDKLVLTKNCHLAVHSAKDLPEKTQLPILALTRGLDPIDLLVYQEFYLWNPLPKFPRIGSSSSRRAEILKKLFPQAKILDIRGTIEERLELLSNNQYDAVVIAKAALLRLHFHPSCTQELPPPYHPLQGRLAVTAAHHLDAWAAFLAPINQNIS